VKMLPGWSRSSSKERYTVRRDRIVLAAAMAIFVGSFFGTAVVCRSTFISGTEVPGFSCAEITILMPWSDDGAKLLHEYLLGYIATLLSGWINLVFLVTVVLLFRDRAHRLANVLRTALLLMLPACWIVFFYQNLRPGYAYFLWTAAMLLALFSSSFSNLLVRTAPARSVDLA
jgi:hypothetical protein